MAGETFRIEFPNLQRVLSGATKVNRHMAKIVGEAAHVEAEATMARSKDEFVPVDLGALKNSGHVAPLKVDDQTATVELGYGGPAAPYALAVHEIPPPGGGGYSQSALDARIEDFNLSAPTRTATHKVGQWKYLEQPLFEDLPKWDDHMAKDLAAAMAAETK